MHQCCILWQIDKSIVKSQTHKIDSPKQLYDKKNNIMSDMGCLCLM